MGFGTTSAEERARLQHKLRSGDWWKPKEGANHIRIMPPWNETVKRWWMEQTVHWNVGPHKARVACLLKHGGGRCAVCEYVNTLNATGDGASAEVAKDMAPQWGVEFSIIDLDAPTLGIQTYRAGRQIMNGILDYDSAEDYGDVTDPLKGFNIIIQRGPRGSQPLYTVRATRNQTPISAELLPLLRELPDLEANFRIFTYEEQLTILNGGEVSISSNHPRSPVGHTSPMEVEAANVLPDIIIPPPAPASITHPAPPPCFGVGYVEGDQICGVCNVGDDCKAKFTVVTTDKIEQTTAIDTPPPISTTTPPPRCFQKMYDGRSNDCQRCDHAMACKEGTA